MDRKCYGAGCNAKLKIGELSLPLKMFKDQIIYGPAHYQSQYSCSIPLIQSAPFLVTEEKHVQVCHLAINALS